MTRPSDRFEGTSNYIATDDLRIAVNAAIALERPLLIKGEPGTGKTVLAYEMARALNVFKMRGSWHDKGIREFVITSNGPEIKDSFSNFERIISGVPHRISDERSDLARIVRGVVNQGSAPAGARPVNDITLEEAYLAFMVGRGRHAEELAASDS